jgi:hypothetical protein
MHSLLLNQLLSHQETNRSIYLKKRYLKQASALNTSLRLAQNLSLLEMLLLLVIYIMVKLFYVTCLSIRLTTPIKVNTGT